MDTDKLNWKTVSFGDIGLNPDFEGLIGIEECYDYNVVNKNRRKRGGKKIKELKRKASKTDDKNVTTPKKVKNSSFGDFQVEEVSPETVLSPSSKITKVNEKKNTTAKENVVKENKTKQKSKKKKQKDKSKKAKENVKLIEAKEKSNTEEENDEIVEKEEVTDIPLDDMQAWSQFNLPDVILKGLALQKFTNPTEIQELTLPAAIFGRRDILGAAETGSGKTLAFGIPMINSIIQLKERPFMGMNEKFRKPKKGKSEENSKKNEQSKIINYNKLNSDEKSELLGQFKKSKKGKIKRKHDFDEETEEDEDSHCSDPESDDEEDLGDDSDVNEDNNEPDGSDLDLEDDGSEQDDSEDEGMDSDEEIDNSDDFDDVSEGSDMDEDNSDMDNGIFMSASKVKKLIESRKLAKSQKSVQNGKDKKTEKLNESAKKTKKIDKDSKKKDKVEEKPVSESEESDFEEKEEGVEGVNEKGVGCVKVIDNVESSDLPNWNEQRKALKPLYALVLTPTRELAIQVKNHLEAAAKFTGISVAVVVGGMSQEKQERLLSRGPEIVVATPGRLWQLIQMGNAHLSQIADIKFFVIDETDRMLEHGHFEELHQLLERLNEDEGKRGGRQNFVFSATLTMVHDLPTYLKKKKVTKNGKLINRKIKQLTADQKLKQVIEMLGITDPKIIDVTKQNQGTSTTLMECRIVCSIEQKDYYLYYVLKRHPGRAIIFCNSIGCVKRLSQLFGLLQCNPLPLHANMQQRQRLKNLDRFIANPHGVLVATDVAARGLDIPNVEHVIHYQVPRTAENYVHRSGRTARASKEGITILIMEAGEVQNYNKMCKTLNKQEDLPHFPIDNPLLAAVMQRVDMARELDLLMLKVRKDNSQKGWLEKAAKEMDMVIDELNMPKGADDELQSDLKYVLNSQRKQLTSLLASPLFPKGFSFRYPSYNAHLEEALGLKEGQNAIQVMKTALESGAFKKNKNTTMNHALLKLQQKVVPINKAATNLNDGEKLSKNKWKKMRRTKE